VAVVVKCKPVLSRQCRTFQSLKLTQDKGLFQCQLMADSALAVLGRSLCYALVVTADVTLRAALSAADNPTSAAFAAATRAARGTDHSVTADLPAGAAGTAANGLAFAALDTVASASKSGSGLAQAERSQYCASNGAADQAQHFSP
jgi:hypothetical protein